MNQRKVWAWTLLIALTGLGGWYLFQPRRDTRQDANQAFAKMAQQEGLEESFVQRVGNLVIQVTSPETKQRELSQQDYDLLYRALETDKPLVQQQALVVLGWKPAPNQERLYGVILSAAERSKDEGTQEWMYRMLWNTNPTRHRALIDSASKSNFPGIAQEMQRWPDTLTKDDP